MKSDNFVVISDFNAEECCNKVSNFMNSDGLGNFWLSFLTALKQLIYAVLI